jgi:hypothetical protein
MTIAPDPKFPESPGTMYDRKFAPATPGQRGPLRFEEGVATDTDVPEQFTTGALQGYMPAPGRPNRNAPVWQKTAEETMRERAHGGSAAWVEAPMHLSEFASGGFADHGDNRFEEVFRSGAHQAAPNPAAVND